MPSRQHDLIAPELWCYRTSKEAPAISPAGSRRGWMDDTVEHFAYRCTPMVIANASGWELLSPYHIEAEWSGHGVRDAIVIRARGQPEKVRRFVCSHFGGGILTFHPGYVFRTTPGWALWTRGSPNRVKPFITPLEGIVETEWLPFTFTMNWRFTEPGKVVFEKDEPFCFITLAPHAVLDDVTPRVSDIKDDASLKADYDDWRVSRRDFNVGLTDPRSAESRQGWQKRYLAARDAPEPAIHKVKRRLRAPVEDAADDPV